MAGTMDPRAELLASMEQHVGCFKSNPSGVGRENCSQCRWRKVRCDRRRGARGGCGSCERLGLSCSFSRLPRALGRDQGSGDSGKPRRLRGPRACAACREKKIRCSATLPQCVNCKRKGQACTYPTPKRPLQDKERRDSSDLLGRDDTDDRDTDDRDTDDIGPGEPADEPAPTVHATRTPSCHGEGTSSSPSPAVSDSMLALVDAFFETLYPLPSYAFLHPQTTKRRCHNGQMHRALASAICAVTSLHLGHRGASAVPATSLGWVKAAEQSIWMHLECPTIPRLQTLLLVIYHRVETGQFQRAFMLTATAARFASAMRLNYERPGLDPVAREVRRRIVWSLKIVERYFCVGLPEFELCPIEAIYLDLPSTEQNFGTDQPGENGAYGLHVKLEVVRRDIMKLTRSLSPLDEPLPSLTVLILHHANTLAEVGSSMPDGTQLSTPQIVDLLSNPWLPRRLPMHISWHQAHCDLYRILLPGYPEAAPAVVLDAVDASHLEDAERQCLRHATSAINILTSLNQESTRRHALEFDTAICAYHATRLLLFISRFGRSRDRPTPEFAASRADLCLAALRRFFPSSALVTPIVEELQYSIGVFMQQHHREGFAAADLSRDGEQSPERDTRETGRRRGSRSAAKARQKLAVHSLLRQAEFSDEEDEKATPADLASTEELSQSLPPVAERPERGPADDETPQIKPGPEGSSSVRFACGLRCPELGGGWNTSTPFAMGQVFDSFGVEQPLFSWGGPQDWDWLFEPEQT